MRDYGKIYVSFWTSADTSSLSMEAKLLGAYLLSSSHTNMIGCFRLPVQYVCSDLQFASESVLNAFAELSTIGFATYDEKHQWIIIHNFLKWNRIENHNQGKAAMKLAEQIPSRSILNPYMVKSLETFGKHLPESAMKQLRKRIDGGEKPCETHREPFPEGSETVSKGFPKGFETVSEPAGNPEGQESPGAMSDASPPAEMFSASTAAESAGGPESPSTADLETVSKGFPKGFETLPETVRKPFRNQEQEQEQEQEKNKRYSASPAPGEPESAASPPGPSAPDGAVLDQRYLTRRRRKLSGWKLEAFEEFWSTFAYKKGRAEAADAWLDIPDLTRELAARITKAAAREARARPGLIARGGTPKMAQGWLSARRWEDWENNDQPPDGPGGAHGPKAGDDADPSGIDEEAQYRESIRDAVKRFM
ncbi:MAG TPA: hypothetical protein PLM79_16925 [Syntrophobacteraceae bacterium]|nr:hypothetical protein [Syntrophobacteraceae bacterium]